MAACTYISLSLNIYLEASFCAGLNVKALELFLPPVFPSLEAFILFDFVLIFFFLKLAPIVIPLESLGTSSSSFMRAPSIYNPVVYKRATVLR